mmetsp:Transcript_24793/g.55971  ORF Transcript_24793/g.55971 Transcript_24793/m.55971 type:complete len:251 (-) Transcript_24793:27-779(-)
MFNLFSLKRPPQDEFSSHGVVETRSGGLEGIPVPNPVQHLSSSESACGHALATTHDCIQEGSHPKPSTRMFHSACTCCARKQPMQQTLEEMDFDRGIWGAAAMGDLQRIGMLLDERGRDVNACDSFGYTALHYSARSGKPETCELLLVRKANVNAPAGQSKATALHRACIGGHLSTAKLLVNHAADLAGVDADGENCLHKAARSKNASLVEYLLMQSELDVAHRNKHGRTAAEVALCEDVAAVLRTFSHE